MVVLFDSYFMFALLILSSYCSMYAPALLELQLVGLLVVLASSVLLGLQALSLRRWPPLGAFIKLPALRVVHDYGIRL